MENKIDKKSEMEILRSIQLALCEIKGLRLWRGNVTGSAWVGDILSRQGSRVTLQRARPWQTHLPPGFPDLFGFIGLDAGPIPVFIEVKSLTGAKRRTQVEFIAAMQAAGCRAGFARSVDDAMKIVKGMK